MLQPDRRHAQLEALISAATKKRRRQYSANSARRGAVEYDAELGTGWRRLAMISRLAYARA